MAMARQFLVAQAFYLQIEKEGVLVVVHMT